MQFDIIVNSLISIVIFSALTAYLLYRRLMSDVRTLLRVHMSGGTEKEFKAVEVGREVKWIQDGEEMTAMIPLTVDPGHTRRTGLNYRVFNVTDGSDEVIPVPWLQPNIHAKYLEGDAGAKERYRRRIRAQSTFKQLAAGLSSINAWNIAGYILLGLFAGMFLYPLIAGLGN